MKKIFFIIIIFLAANQTNAQNMTNSPSSMFGLGDISTGDGGIYAGMGGVSIALRSPDYLSASNPASLTGIGNQKFLFNVGLMGAVKEFTQSNSTNKSFVGNVSNLGFGFKVIPRWYAALTINPVSSVGYRISLDQQVEGSPGSTVTSLFEGDGGLSRISFSNGFLISKRLSVGLNLSYTTGTITQTESQGSAILTEKSDKRAVHADFGLQYIYPLGKNRSVTTGLIYGYSQKLAQDNTLTVSSSSGSEGIEESQRAVKQYLPAFYGLGVAYNSTRWITTAEYKYMDWSKMKSNQSTINYENQHRIAFGASYLVGSIYNPPKYIMVGAGYYNSYVIIKNQKPQNYYISAGYSFTTSTKSIVTFGVKYNNQFKVSPNAQKERMFSLFLNLAFNERVYRGKLK